MTKSSECISIDTQLVVPLQCLSKFDLERAGGKAANLGELIRGGFPVPPGFAVTTAAYDRFVAHNLLQETVVQALSAQSTSGMMIRSVFEQAPIPAEIEQDILAAYQQLGQGPVAVRSSATAEDLPGASFAGQQDTFLNIVGTDALLEAVRRCWSSLWTDRAISYRASQDVDQLTVKLAVVVQRMVAADAAGVLFSANPVTGAREETIIDASPGLGEVVVSGLVTPDHFVLRRGRWGWRIAERRTGQHEVVIRARSGGGTQHLTGTGTAQLPALPKHVLIQLARFGTAIQRHFGTPQDIEWAWAEGKLFILQARPITALPTPLPHANKLQRMLANNFIEMLPVRPYPLDLDTWIIALGSAVEPIFDLLGLDWSFIQLFEVEDSVIIRYTPDFPRPTWNTLHAPLRLISLMMRYNPIEWKSDPLLADMIARARDLESRDVGALSWKQLLKMVSAAKEIPFLGAGKVRVRYFPRAAFSTVRLRLLLGIMRHTQKLGTLLSGVENKTLEMNHALEELAQKIRSDPELTDIFATHSPESLEPVLEQLPGGRAFLSELQTFFDRYGHRETIISTALQPTWKDAPEVVLGILKGFAAHPPQHQTRKPDWQEARDEILQHPLLSFAPLRSAFLRILTEARALLQIREDTHFYATLVMPIFRRVFFEMGKRLTLAGVLDAAEDVFHLTLSELEKVPNLLPLSADLAAELRPSATRRKAARTRLEDTPLVDPRIFPSVAMKGDALLQGTAGSPGVIEGPARIIHGMNEFDRLAAGEVLIAPYTNPSWTPLFQRAAAVVVDSGSPASHAAIVAREYGIPAVMATRTGTSTLQDGEWIRVDGYRGMVFRKPAQAAEITRTTLDSLSHGERNLQEE